MRLKLADQWALITGASSGLGAEFARQLAARGMHLILTARRKERLETLASELFTQYRTKTVIIPLDLSETGAATELIAQVRQLPDPVTMVVNNAGFGSVTTIEATEPERILKMVELNIKVLTQLTYEFLPDFIRRNEGGVLNVASVTAFQPIAYMGVYAASKAYVLHFTEALWAELRGTRVRMLALCPGTTRTEFFDQAGVNQWLKKHSSHTPEQVVARALRAYEKKRSICVPGLKNKLMVQIPRYVRRRKVVSETRRFFQKAAEQNAANSRPR